MTEALSRMKFSPKGMGLNDFVAMEEGFFRDEGLDVEIDRDIFHGMQNRWDDDSYFERPQDMPYAKDEEVVQGACLWGTICNASAGMGKVVGGCHGESPWAIFVRADSPAEKPEDLKDVPIAVGLRAGPGAVGHRQRHRMRNPGHIAAGEDAGNRRLLGGVGTDLDAHRRFLERTARRLCEIARRNAPGRREKPGKRQPPPVGEHHLGLSLQPVDRCFLDPDVAPLERLAGSGVEIDGSVGEEGELAPLGDDLGLVR